MLTASCAPPTGHTSQRRRAMDPSLLDGQLMSGAHHRRSFTPGRERADRQRADAKEREGFTEAAKRQGSPSRT